MQGKVKQNCVRDHCHYAGECRRAAHGIHNLKYSIPKEIILFHNGFDCGYHFMVKELAKEFERQFTCLGENAEKCNLTGGIHKMK